MHNYQTNIDLAKSTEQLKSQLLSSWLFNCLISSPDLYRYVDYAKPLSSSSVLKYILNRLGLNHISHYLISMSNEERIEVAEQRIIELKTLINHWKTSNISSRRATVDFVDAILSDRDGAQAA